MQHSTKKENQLSLFNDAPEFGPMPEKGHIKHRAPVEYFYNLVDNVVASRELQIRMQVAQIDEIERLMVKFNETNAAEKAALFLQDLNQGKSRKIPDSTRNGLDLICWAFEPEQDHFFCFDQCCTASGYDADRFRAALLESPLVVYLNLLFALEEFPAEYREEINRDFAFYKLNNKEVYDDAY